MFTCGRCRLSISDEKATTAGSKAYPWCRTCKADYDRAYYQSTKSRRRERKRLNMEPTRQRNRNYVMTYLLTHPCVDCGEADPIVLEFDHRDPASKVATISALISWSAALDRLVAEIAKCDVRCANCHRRRTAQQFAWWPYQALHPPGVA